MQKKKSLNYYCSLAEYKESALDADAQRKTAQGTKYVMDEQVQARRMRQAMGPYGSFSPYVEDRLEDNAEFLYENRKVVTDPKSVKVTGKKKKK